MPDAPDVATLGEALVALVGAEPLPLDSCTVFRRFVAGAESNVAIGLSRLGHHCRWLGRVGDDACGRTVLRQLRGEGVEVAAITDPAAGTAVLLRDARPGPTEVLYHRRDSAGSRLEVGDLGGFPWSARLVHLSGVTPALSPSARAAWFAALRAAGSSTVVLDPNLRRRLWSDTEARAVLLQALPSVDILLPGCDELEVLSPGGEPAEQARRLLAAHPRLAWVGVKLGPSGSLAVTRDAVHACPAEPLAAVADPVGAGDAWAAGCIAGLLRGWDLPRCLALANANGAAACRSLGDSDGYLRSDQTASTTHDILR